MRDRSAEKLLVKERVALEDLVREVVSEMTPRGGDLWACCPFHAEDTPSFHVRPALGVYKCFGCGESGDVFSFVQKTRGIGFREALQFLAERVGVQLSSLTPEDLRKQADARQQREVLSTALDVFRKAMGKVGRPALDYLYERGFTRETLLAWDVGFIPDDFLARLRDAGLSSSQIEGAGFTRLFGGRIGFGIRDGNGALVGFGARRLGDGDTPKYVNTRETPAFNKRNLLYGMSKASLSLGKTRRLVVMEGYTDVMMAHQRGLSEAVATMGTSFTNEHMALARGRAGNLIFVFDGDEAGQRAAERAVDMVLEDGRECRVLLLPDEVDPCEWFSVHTTEEFEQQLEADALGTVAFLARRELQRLDAGQPGGRETVARDVLTKAGKIRDSVRREALVAEIARECGVDRNELRRVARAGAASSRAPVADVDFGGGGRRVPLKAHVRSQFVAVAGLATEVGRLQEIEALVADGVIAHAGALRLLEVGRALLEPTVPEAAATEPTEAPQESTGAARLDGIEWLAALAETDPALRPALEKVLLPPPDVVMPSYEEAVSHLRREQEDQRLKQSRRDALARPGLAHDTEALQRIDSELRARAAVDHSLQAAPAPEN